MVIILTPLSYYITKDFTMRIDQLISQLKYGSRSDMQNFLRKHKVTINGKPVLTGKTHVDPHKDMIEIDGVVVFYQYPIDLMVYKPKGYLSANIDPIHPCVTKLIKEPYQRFDFAIAGRLDLDAEGLLILTTDGNFAHHITHPSYHLPKVYEVILDKSFNHETSLLSGVMIKDGKNQDFLAKALTITFDENHVKISIDEGKFHQVKRMFAAVGYTVLNLKRIQIGSLKLGELKPGEHQPFDRRKLYD